MVVIILGLLLVGFLVYAAVLLARMRREDPALWPLVEIAAAKAKLRIHPSWSVHSVNDVLRFETGVGEATVLVKVCPRPERSSTSSGLLRDFLVEEGISLDSSGIETIQIAAGVCSRIASAGTLPGGGRRYFEVHLVRGQDLDLLFDYRCPVLQGSIDSLTLARSIGTLEFDGLEERPDGADVGTEPNETVSRIGQ